MGYFYLIRMNNISNISNASQLNIKYTNINKAKKMRIFIVI